MLHVRKYNVAPSEHLIKQLALASLKSQQDRQSGNANQVLVSNNIYCPSRIDLTKKFQAARLRRGSALYVDVHPETLTR